MAVANQAMIVRGFVTFFIVETSARKTFHAGCHTKDFTIFVDKCCKHVPEILLILGEEGVLEVNQLPYGLIKIGNLCKGR